MPLDAKAHKILIGATTATITTILLKRGLRGAPLPGLYPMNQETGARYAAWTESSDGEKG